jgi:hypothetical protein
VTVLEVVRTSNGYRFLDPLDRIRAAFRPQHRCPRPSARR